jgi:hypothetical protein
MATRGPWSGGGAEATTDDRKRKEPKDVEHRGGRGRGEEAAEMVGHVAADEREDGAALKRIRCMPRTTDPEACPWSRRDSPPATEAWQGDVGDLDSLE